MASTEQRVHAVCDRYVDDYAAADPVTATMQGIAGHDDRLTDYSPDGYARRGELAARARAEVTATEPGDVSEQSAQAVFTERLGIDLELHEAGLDLAQLRSEERRVGKECRARWSPCGYQNQADEMIM